MSEPLLYPCVTSAMADSRSVRRFEDLRFVTGQGQFVDDLASPNGLFAAFLRSPHAHADIIGINMAAARSLKGVYGVYSASDVLKSPANPEGLGPLPTSIPLGTETQLVVPRRDPLCRDRVRHVGDLVAMVVADCPRKAQDALELITVDYHVLEAVVDPAAAHEASKARIWAEAPHNQAFVYQRGDDSRTQAAFAKARHQVELTVVNNRIAAVALEPRCAVGLWDAKGHRYRLIVSAASVHFIRDELASGVFGIPKDQIEVMSPDVGGGFGMKNVTYPEYALVLWAAKRLQRPIRWTADRLEDFTSGVHGRDNITRARLALDRKGRFLALAVETIANIGAYVTSLGPGSATVAPTPAMGGVYAFPVLSMNVRGVFTNMAPIDAYRGAGKPEANYMLERLIDLAAHQLRICPAELRRRNFITQFPFTNGTGFTIDCGVFEHNLDKALAAIDHTNFAKRRALSKKAGQLRGLGIGCFLETSRGPAEEEAWLRPTADGSIEIVVGTQSNGQGHETSFVQLIAKQLSLPLLMLRYVQADTHSVPTGGGHGGARSLHMGGTALVYAARDLLEKTTRIAARYLQVDPETVEYVDGVFYSLTRNQTAPDPQPKPQHIDMRDLIVAFAEVENLELISGYGAFRQAPITFPNGCHAAEVEIDPDTGAVTILHYVAVDDYGTLINPMLTESQVHGGLAQGIGQAMLEAIQYDHDTGQLITSSLMDYALPRAADLPAFDIHLVECPTSSNPLGCKGAGQAGAIGAPQTIINAIVDALKPTGITHIDMPATPLRILAALRNASGS